jgi:hypothetical protein
MGFLSSLVSATVKTALTPIAIVKDTINVVSGEEADTTKNLLESAGEDIDDAINEL